jgi:6-phosphogluconolactonase (cycloisomerase 2 family)
MYRKSMYALSVLGMVLGLLLTGCPSPYGAPYGGPSSAMPPAGTGDLVYRDHYASSGISHCEKIVFSANGLNAYLITGDYDRLVWFTRDPETGDLSSLGGFSYPVLSGIRDVVLSANERFVYICTAYTNTLTWFARDPDTGDLVLVDHLTDPLLTLTGQMAAAPNGRDLYVVGSQGVVRIALNSDTGAATIMGWDTRAAVANAKAVAFSPDHRYVYVASNTNQSIAWYLRDAATGALTFQDTWQDTVRGLAAQTMFISPDGRFLYYSSTHASSGKIVWLSRDTGTGELSFAGIFSNDYLENCHITPSTDWKNIYAVGYMTPGAILWFTRDPITGWIKFTGSISGLEMEELDGARGVSVSPDNRNVYTPCGAGATGSLVWFLR